MSPVPPPSADESLRPALEALAAADPDLARAYAALGLPAARPRQPGFGGLLRIITGQQVSAHAARAIVARLEAAADPLTPESFLALDDADLRAVGFSRQKVRYGRALAEDVLAGRIDLDALAGMDDEAAIAHLSRARGIGRWTAEIYLLFALGRPDVWPADDLAVRAAAARLKGWPGKQPTRARMQALGETYRPHRSAAARFLWHFYRHPGVVLGADDRPTDATTDAPTRTGEP